MILHHHQHDGGGGAARDAENHQWNQRARSDAVIRRLRRNESLRVSRAVTFGCFGISPGLLVGHERGDARAGARYHTDDQSDNAVPGDMPPARHGNAGAFQRGCPTASSNHVFTVLRQNRFALDHQKSFRDCEKADQGGNERYAVVKLEEAESAARRGVDVVGAYGADHETEKSRN